MICTEDEIDVKTKRQREPDNNNNVDKEEEEKEEESKGLKKRKFEVSEGSEYEDADEESEDEEEKLIVRGKTGYEYCKESDEGVFIDDNEVYIDENNIDTTSEFHYKTREKYPMELQRMKDEHVRHMIKEEDNELSNTSNTFAKHTFDLKKKILQRKKIVRFRIKLDEIFNKQNMLFAVKREL
jgi:hypothetical protein